MLNTKVFLTRTDTTIGFVSQNAEALTHIKQRLPHKHYIKAVDSLRTLCRATRVPVKHKNRIRRAKRTTFIMPNGHSFRVITDKHHLLLLNRMKWAYTTSANLSGYTYDECFAKRMADVVITPLEGGDTPSIIMKLGYHTIRRIR